MLEILKGTLRTREYVEKGENEGKTLLDAMRDGSDEGIWPSTPKSRRFDSCRSHQP